MEISSGFAEKLENGAMERYINWISKTSLILSFKRNVFKE
jgi:hypothetical protein